MLYLEECGDLIDLVDTFYGYPSCKLHVSALQAL